MAVYFPIWSYMLALKFCMWMVGWFVWMSLSGLHSCVDSLRLVIFKGGVYICCPLIGCGW